MCDHLNNVTLAIVAGGESRRMGISKALLQIDGRPILAVLHDRLAWPGPTMLVTAPGREKPPGHELFDAEAVDPVAGAGPLRGILTALEQTITPLLVVVPVDMPGLLAEPLALLVSSLLQTPGKSLAMFERNQRIEPLPAAFVVKSALIIIRQQLADGCSALRELPDVMETSLVPVPQSWSQSLWVNLNRPEDVEKYHGALRYSPAQKVE